MAEQEKTISTATFTKALKFATKNNASDVHFVSGVPPMLRIAGELKRLDTPAVSEEALATFLKQYLSSEQQERLQKKNEIDLAVALDGAARFRVNIYQQANGISAAFRIIPTQVKSIQELQLPEVLYDLVKYRKGLVLVTGPTGSGKSTSLAAMIREVNNNRRAHIITIEDPIEYVHEPFNCLINQREVGQHTTDFATALRSCLREDPDVILVGEMRDLETITNALRAAETGHLVFSTMHTNSASDTVDRIINVFPPEEQQQVRQALASSLLAVISQRLVKATTEADRVAAMEILLCTPAVKNLIREGKTHQIESMIQTGSEHGMQTFEMSLQNLKQRNLVEPTISLNEVI